MPLIDFIIPGKPESTAQQKGVCAKGSKVVFYKKSAVRAEELRLMQGAAHYKPQAPLTGPLALTIAITFPFNAAEAKKNVGELSNPMFEMYHTRRPDADNAIKTLQDVLSKLKFWKDDAQVCDLNVRKRCGPFPQIRIRVESLQPEAGPKRAGR